ncbi:MAG: hypothetical protein M1828_005133 [Chrysothrix sp. TS-e1954]|nr:MAG: hypothetical protein M1828_005133 [Chrysothrix sp. TS-e1954]
MHIGGITTSRSIPIASHQLPLWVERRLSRTRHAVRFRHSRPNADRPIDHVVQQRRGGVGLLQGHTSRAPAVLLTLKYPAHIDRRALHGTSEVCLDIRTQLRHQLIRHKLRPDASTHRTVDASQGEVHSSRLVAQQPTGAQESPIRPDIRSRLRTWQAEVGNNIKTQPEALYLEEEKPLADRESDDFGGEVEATETTPVLREFDRLTDPENLESSFGYLFAPGDLVELPGAGTEPRLAVFLQFLGDRLFFFDGNGKLHVTPSRRTIFISRGHFSQQEVDDLLRCLPSLRSQVSDTLRPDLIPRRVGAHAVKKLNAFKEGADQYRRQYSTELFDAHGRVARKTDARRMTLTEIATEITGLNAHELNDTILLAINTAIMRDSIGFVTSPGSHAVTQTFWVESTKTREATYVTRRCIRAYKEMKAHHTGNISQPIDDKQPKGSWQFTLFIAKCRLLIQASRASRICVNGNVLRNRSDDVIAKSDQRVSHLQWTRNDEMFISFLSHALTTGFHDYHPTILSLLPEMLRATDMYRDHEKLDWGLCRQFMVEIGVLDYYTHPLPIDRYLVPPQAKQDLQILNMESRIHGGEEPERVAELQDTMSHLRQDWGDLPVYCIDSASTTVVDDGISIERVPGNGEQYWLHVHVAHPSAYLGPGSVLGRRARRYADTIYFTETSLPMFPAWLSGLYSLSPDSSALTFSAKVSLDGDVSDYVVKPSVIRNVVRMTPDDVNSLLSPQTDPSRCNKVSEPGDGHTIDAAPPKSSYKFSQEEKDQFRLLDELSWKMAQKRPPQVFGNVESKRETESSISQSVTDFGTHDLAAFRLSNLEKAPSFDRRSPEINISFTPMQSPLSHRNISEDVSNPASRVVRELMFLAGQVAAMWASTRKLPMPFAGTQNSLGGAEVATAALRELLQEFPDTVSPQPVLRHAHSIYATRAVKSTPIEHRSLGFREYVRVTSPLRRYYDLLACWQIDAVLQEEHRRGSPLVIEPTLEAPMPPESPRSNNPVEPTTPYSHQRMNRALEYQEHRLKDRRRFFNAHEIHWMTIGLARSLYLNEGPRLPNFTAVIREVSRRHQEWSCSIPELSVMGWIRLEQSVGQDGNAIGNLEVWEVRIQDIRVHAGKFYVVPIKRLSKAPSTDTFASRYLHGQLMR